jgi:hypothetical protein
MGKRRREATRLLAIGGYRDLLVEVVGGALTGLLMQYVGPCDEHGTPEPATRFRIVVTGMSYPKEDYPVSTSHTIGDVIRCDRRRLYMDVIHYHIMKVDDSKWEEGYYLTEAMLEFTRYFK